MTVGKQFVKYVSQNILGMTGVWLAFPVAELITLIATTIALRKTNRKILA